VVKVVEEGRVEELNIEGRENGFGKMGGGWLW
jgi:hypothetical protein